MNDGTSGPGSLPVDGAGDVRPPGDVLGLEGELNRTQGANGDLARLGKMNQRANLGNSSTPSTRLGGATDPDPGAGDDSGDADIGDLKQVIDSYDAAVDPP